MNGIACSVNFSKTVMHRKISGFSPGMAER